MKLKTNCYSSAILNEINDLHLADMNILEKENKKVLHFKWTWHDYDGVGQIEFTDKGLCNEFGNDFSCLSLSSSCRVKYNYIKPTCSLYNDKNLESIFNYILDKTEANTIH